MSLQVRTPREVAFVHDVTSLRAPVETGQIGLRPRAEPCVLAIEPGLVVAREGTLSWTIGSAGGLLRCDGEVATLLTPLAVVGRDEQETLARLDELLAQPNVELEVRATLSRLQTCVLRQLREERAGHGAGPESRS